MSDPDKDEWFPDRSEDDSDAGWGEGAAVEDESKRRDTWYEEQRPPHSAE